MVTTGLKQPSGMAWLPDGRLLVIEQVTGNVRLIVNDALVAAPIFTVPDVNTDFVERGLLGQRRAECGPVPDQHLSARHGGEPLTLFSPVRPGRISNSQKLKSSRGRQ